MAEGFRSIADLQIVVDASTEKLQGNLKSASTLIQRFAGEGTSSLKGFDAGVAALGGGIEAARGKFNVWMEAFKLLSTNIQAVKAVSGSLAEKIGAKDDFDRVLGSFDELREAVGEGLAGGWDRARAAAGLYHAAAADGGDLAPSKVFSKAAADATVETVGQISHAFRRLGDESKYSSKTIDSEFSLVEHKLNQFAAEARRVAAEGSLFDGLLGTDSVTANLEVVAEQLERVARLNELRRANGAANSAAERAAADALGAAEFEKLVPNLEKEIEALERKGSVLNMTKGEAAAYAAVMQVIDALVKNNALLTEDAAEKLGAYSARIRELTDAADGFAKIKQAETFVAGLGREIRNLDQQSAGLGKSTAAIAATSAEMRIRNQIEDQGLQLSDEQKSKVEEAIAAIRSRTLAYAADKRARDDAERGEKGFEGALLKLQRETMLLREKAAALGDASDAGAIKARVDRELADLQARNIPLSAQRVAALEAEITAQVEARRARADFEKQMASVREAGQVVSRSLESAFAKWTEGGKINVKEMVASMIADLAQLTLKRGVIDQLFGGGGSGAGGGGGGLLGSLAGSLFGGGGAAIGSWSTSVIPAFADGGRPPLDRPSLIGERGPELFWPDSLGTVIPNGQFALGGGGAPGPVHVAMHTHINAQGAYPESIADIKRELATAQASLPGRVVQVVREAQDRGIA